ncbi:hypothetical protein Q1695_001255 [Nippostrongylus brasiliensis]|nr:hypothetical protein Q1695_001255 [Nippostrongylus brasiliensis]
MVVSLSFTSMFSPRSGPILNSIGVLYILFCMYTITSLCRFIYGSRERLSTALTDNDATMSFQVPPCCCCMPCLPKAAPSARNLKILEFFALQGCIVRAVIVIINSHFLAEKGHESEFLLQMTELAGVISLLFTLFGSHATARLLGEYVQKYKFMAMFRFVDATLALYTAQFPLIFHLIFVNLGVITCGPILSAIYNAKYLVNFTMICEGFLLSVLATRLLLPEKCALFDKSPHQQLCDGKDTEKAMLEKQDS